MARSVAVSIRFGGRLYYADVDPGERADQLLQRSLHHFGIDPTRKERYRLVYAGEERPAHGIYLDHPIGDQVESGAELELQEDVAGNKPMATGSY